MIKSAKVVLAVGCLFRAVKPGIFQARVGDWAVDRLLIFAPRLFAISDTTADVLANIAALNANSHLSVVTLTDEATPSIVLNVSLFAANAFVFGKTSNAAYNITVSDSAANVSANIAALNGNAHLAAVTLTDTGTPTLTPVGAAC